MDEKWLVVRVGSAEYSNGQESLVEVLDVYPSLEAAKDNSGDFRTVWTERPGGGSFSHSASGGIEIVPLP